MAMYAGAMLQMEFAELCGEKVQLSGVKTLKFRVMITQLEELLNLYKLTEKHKLAIFAKIKEISSAISIEGARKQLETWRQFLEVEEKAEIERQKKQKNSNFDFSDLVVSTSKYLGYRIPLRETTLSEFAEMVKNFKNELKREEKKQKIKK